MTAVAVARLGLALALAGAAAAATQPATTVPDFNGVALGSMPPTPSGSPTR